MNALATARTRATVAVSDLSRARAFYAETLGLHVSEERPGAITCACGDGTTLDVYESALAGTAKTTVASFEVADIAVAVSELRDRGVVFDTFGAPTANDVVERDGIRGTWFHDPDGNVLAVVQHD